MARVYAWVWVGMMGCASRAEPIPASPVAASNSKTSVEQGASPVTSAAAPDQGDPFMSDRLVARSASNCKDWRAWADAGVFQECSDDDHPVRAFGREAQLHLFRDRDSRVVGHALSFHGCTPEVKADLIQAVRKEYQLGSGTDLPYSIDGDTTYHMECDPNSCRVTVAEGDFAKAFVGNLIGEGMSGLFRINH